MKVVGFIFLIVLFELVMFVLAGQGQAAIKLASW